MNSNGPAPVWERAAAVLAREGLPGAWQKTRDNISAEFHRAALWWSGRAGASLLRHDLPIPPDQVRRILFIKLWGLGDMVMATPLLAMLRARFPQARITLAGPPSVGRVLEGTGVFDSHIVIPWLAIHNTSPDLYRSLRRMRELKADLVIVSSPLNSPRIGAMLDRLDSRWVIASEKSAAAGRVSALTADPYDRHLVEVNADLARAAGADGPTPPLQLWLSEGEREAADQWLGVHASFSPRICFHVGSIPTLPQKKWPAGSFIELGNRLSARQGAPVILLAGPDEAEAVREVSAGLKRPSVVAGPELSLRATMALVERMDLVVAGSSVWAHVAAAVRAPLICIVGPTPPSYNPWGDAGRIRVLAGDADCAPCWGRGRTLDCPDPRCIVSVSVEAAERAAEELLALRGAEA